jgi:capsular polysaccharide transport system permease protein
MNELVEPLPGTLLSTAGASPEREIHEISVAMLPLQHPEHLVNVADNFGAGWLDPQSKQLRLQFQLVTIFSNAKTERLWLSIPGNENKLSLSPSQIPSPVMSQKYPELPWSGHSRFVVDEVVDLPDWVLSSNKLELLAGVDETKVNLGVIYFGKNFNSAKDQLPNRNDETATVVPAAANAAVVILSGVATTSVKPRVVEINSTRDIITKYIQKMFVQIKSMNRLLLLTVVLPTLISSIYFGLIASDVYISESRFVVRSPGRQTNAGLGALLQGTGFSRSEDDTYTVHDYIFSRDALKQLDDQFALGKTFASSNVDIFSRFSGLNWDNSFEALYRYYQKHVTVDMETSSSISTLSVSAFTPENAYQINEKLLELSESLVNRLNERGRQDMIQFASAEVATAEQKAKTAALAVSNYRNLKGVFDPEKQSALQLGQVSKLQEELIASQIQLAQVRTLTRDNPQIPALQKSIETLKTQIDLETAKVAGGGHSLSNQSAEYERLALERDFAGKQLASTLASLEQARNDAQRKQLYLERIVQPSKPDVAMEPRRIRNVFATFMLGLIAWGILTMLLAGIREHQD